MPGCKLEVRRLYYQALCSPPATPNQDNTPSRKEKKYTFNVRPIQECTAAAAETSISQAATDNCNYRYITLKCKAKAALHLELPEVYHSLVHE